MNFLDAVGVNRRRERRDDNDGQPSLALSAARRRMRRPSPSPSPSQSSLSSFNRDKPYDRDCARKTLDGGKKGGKVYWCTRKYFFFGEKILLAMIRNMFQSCVLAYFFDTIPTILYFILHNLRNYFTLSYTILHYLTLSYTILHYFGSTRRMFWWEQPLSLDGAGPLPPGGDEDEGGVDLSLE